MSLKKKLVKVRDVALNYRDETLGTRSYEKYVIISRSRTGSNLLISLLDSHPQIMAKGELFRRLEENSTEGIWNDIFNKKQFGVKFVGFKIFYYHPIDSEDKSVWNRLIEDKNIKVIHLVRENMLKTFVSRKIAEKTDTWKAKSKKSVSVQEKQVTLDFDECVNEFERIKQWEAWAREEFKGHDFHELSYEDLVSNRESTMKDLFSFFGVKNKQVESKLKKQNAETLNQLILNYEEIKSELSRTQWSYLLD